MLSYLLKRILLIIPTLFGITILSFVIINLAPGGPIEQKIQQMRFGTGETSTQGGGSRGQSGVSQELIQELKAQYGFDKPVLVRYWIWVKNIATLNFGETFADGEPVIDVIIGRFPVSLQFGIISFFLTYLICIPLGVKKAVRDGTPYDMWTSFGLMIMYSVPALMLGILLLVFFAGGEYFQWFPAGGIQSDNFSALTPMNQIIDRVHHFVLPLICYMIGSFTTLTLLMKNSLLDAIKMDYVRTARAKGLEESVVVYKHALRNALIPVVTGVGGFIGIFLSGSLIIEKIFNLNGIGLLGFEAALQRDYNILMALIFISAVASLLGRLISDLLYIVVDPRIDFN